MTTLEEYEEKLKAKCTKLGHDFFKAFVLTYLRQEISPPPLLSELRVAMVFSLIAARSTLAGFERLNYKLYAFLQLIGPRLWC